MAGLDKISTYEYTGKKETLDLEIDSKFHNFYASDICASNSHALCYSYLAMETLYLKHYYPTEFYTALLNHPKKSGEKEERIRKLSMAISAAISKGIKVLPPSRKSGWEWTMTGDKEISMGFSGINGFGEAAFKELQNLMEVNNKTFETITPQDFFELSFSDFDKSTFKFCVKAGVFDDWSDSRQFLIFLRDKKRKKKDPAQIALAFFDLEDEPFDFNILENNTYPKTTHDEKVADFLEVCHFDLNKIEKATRIKDEINKISKSYIDNVVNFEEPGWYYFIINKIDEMTSKNNNIYLKIKIGDGINNVGVNIFGKYEVEKMKKDSIEDQVCVAEFEKTETGFLNLKRGSKIIKLDFDSNGFLIKKPFSIKNDVQLTDIHNNIQV